ncbi:MAG: PAS domain S-box protein [Euryarchaeota archaeon]|nr:PAS domain S-box protein [Euryarchaeota archaeon]
MSLSLKVLVVEDSEDDAILLLRELRLGGFDPNFRQVYTPKDMENALTQQSWDIVIADYVMPNFSGLDALEKLKESGLDLPFIIVSGKIGEDILVEAMKAGAHDYIKKDNLSRLIPAINRELKEAKVRKKRKEAELALKRSEDTYRTIFENTGTAMTILEEDMAISIVNTEFEKFSGFSKEDIENQKNLAEFVAKEDLKRMKGYHRLRKIDPNAVPKNYEIRLRDRHGKSKDFFATLDMIPGTEKRIGSFIDITDRKQAEDKIKASLKEKEVLLREIHHRVKNNMQIISTLLSLQSEQIKDKRMIEFNKESQTRIQSMALIHENLYQSEDLARINFSEYVNNLIEELFHSYGVNPDIIEPNISVEDVTLNIETAIPCGLIINELISNSLKYAFPGGMSGEIILELHSDDKNRFTLTVSDNGVGFPEDIDFKTSKTLGMQLIYNLTRQLDGKIQVEKDKKIFRITFTELKYKERI